MWDSLENKTPDGNYSVVYEDVFSVFIHCQYMDDHEQELFF